MGDRATQPRRVGKTKVEVTALSLGTAPLGGLFTTVPDDQAHAVVRRALDLGLGYIDTAPLYGHGVAEHRVGQALTRIDRTSYVLSSKVGRLIVDDPDGDGDGYADAPPSQAAFAYDPDSIKRSLELSLRRLDLDRIDIVYIHDPDDHANDALTLAYPTLAELRDQGVVGAIGVGMNQSRIPTRFVHETDIDAVLVAGRYTLLDQSGAEDLLPACSERGVSVIIGGVYNSGVLASPEPGATYNYATAPADLIDQAQQLAAITAAHEVPLTAAAIQFPLWHPAVTSVLTGARSVDELEANLAAFEYDIPAACWDDLAAAGVDYYRDAS